MRVLVTGSAGFIGRAVVHQLRGCGWTVCGLDKVAGEKDDYVCDLLDATRLADCITGHMPDAVVHLAARTDLDEKRDIAGYAANIEGVENLIIAVGKTPSIQRVIWTSSQLVCRVGYVPRNDSDYSADTLYGQSKVLTERLVRRHDGAGRAWCVARPTTVWGPGMGAHYRRLLRMIERGLYFHVGNSALYKSYGYIGNVAYQYRRLLEVPRDIVHGNTFYVADYEPIDLQAWCNALQRGLHSRPIRRMPVALAKFMAAGGDVINALGFRQLPFTSFRLNNVLTQYRFDLEPTRAVCGEVPYSMEQGVAETVRWFQSLKG